MKKSSIAIGVVLSIIFQIKVFASDSLYVTHSTSVDTLVVENIGSTYEEKNELLLQILNYDINASRVYPDTVVTRMQPFDDLLMNPLFMPLVFGFTPRSYHIHRNYPEKSNQCLSTDLTDSLNFQYRVDSFVLSLNREVLLRAESEQIGSIRYDQKKLPKPERLIFLLDSGKPDVLTGSLGSIPGRKVDLKILPRTQYNPWIKKGNVRLQFSQTYNSPNWSKGGESNMAGLATLYVEANYSDLNKIQFDNNLEVKVGLNTVSSDSLRNLNVSTDQMRAISKFGYKMCNNLYYSLSSEFTTQFLNNYAPNTMTLLSSFLSPAKLFLGLGVDYKKVSKKKTSNLSVLLTPLTCKMSFLYDNVNLNTTSYGIREGRHLGSELGSKISATLNWAISEQVQWKSIFYYYTDFSYVDSDWENTLDLNLNHYFSTSVYVHLKLDDRLERNPGEQLVQMQELFSFGMIYHW